MAFKQILNPITGKFDLVESGGDVGDLTGMTDGYIPVGTATGGLTDSGMTDNGSVMSVRPDTDATMIIGRLRVSSPLTDVASFSHFDRTSSADQGFYQDTNGQTCINSRAGSGRTLDLSLGRIVKAQVQADGAFWASVAPPEIVQPATDTLTTMETSGTLINNFGQATANTQTLPSAIRGLNFIAVIGTDGAGAFNIKPSAADKIYLDGTALDDGDKVNLATPALGDSIVFFSFQTGASSYDWIAQVISGTWIDGGA